MVSEDNRKRIDKDVTTTFVTGKTSCTLIISKDIAKKYGIDEPSHVVVEGTDEGILIRKLEV
jgi:hypothetical protein